MWRGQWACRGDKGSTTPSQYLLDLADALWQQEEDRQ